VFTLTQRLNHTEDFIVAWMPQHKCSCGSQDNTDLRISCMEMLWGARAFLALVSLKLGLDQKGIDSMSLKVGSHFC
jgi:hypothetical protein